MNFWGIHFCMDEARWLAIGLTSGVGFGLAFAWMHVKHIWHKLRHRGSPKSDGCCKHDHN